MNYLLLWLIKRIDWQGFLKYSKPKGWIVCPKDQIDEDTKKIWHDGNVYGVRTGYEIGKLAVLRDLRDNVSPAKWQEICSRHDFKSLDEKYPVNPLLEQKHGKKDSRLSEQTFD